MDIEVKVDGNYTTPRIIIYTNKINKNLSNIIDGLSNIDYKKLKAYKDEKMYILNQNEKELIKMQKENVVKKILMKAVVGFPIGVTLLIISYASIYFIAGKDVFDAELYQLHNINTLICQTLSTGISGYLLSILFYAISSLQNKELENKLITEHPYKSVFTIISSVCIIGIIIVALRNTRIFSKNISDLNIIILVIVYALSGLVFCIKSTREKHLIKEINQKIKERNNHISF